MTTLTKEQKSHPCNTGFTGAFITGNTFPVNLFRRRAEVIPETFEHYLEKLRSCPWESYWGHTNTLSAVNALCRVDLTPREDRPALTTDAAGFPALYGQSYRECWVLTPKYRPGFRPAVGVEVAPGDILSWHTVRILWNE